VPSRCKQDSTSSPQATAWRGSARRGEARQRSNWLAHRDLRQQLCDGRRHGAPQCKQQPGILEQLHASVPLLLPPGDIQQQQASDAAPQAQVHLLVGQLQSKRRWGWVKAVQHSTGNCQCSAGAGMEVGLGMRNGSGEWGVEWQSGVECMLGRHANKQCAHCNTRAYKDSCQ